MKRSVHSTFRTKEFLEGAGVRLHRGFSYMPENLFDPFLLFDDFSSENPVDYLAGFPWHPHRGIETVTYILKGDVEHKDSIGNEGIISKGDIQWMSAGSGIIHQEMPKGARGLTGFQLWINIPASKKMDPPGYQEHIAKEIPEFEYSKGVVARLISGVLGENVGPIARDTVDPTYIDFLLKPSTTLEMNLTDGYTTFIYIFEGCIHIGSEQYDAGSVVLLHKKGTVLSAESSSSGARILVVSGRALHEPVAWHGPIVMNTKEQLIEAFTDLQNGTFIK